MRREVCLLGFLVFALVLLLSRQGRTVRLVLAADDDGHETLVVAGTGAYRDALFLVDTAYAGAPVLSTSYLATLAEGTSGLLRGSVEARYRAAVRRLRQGVAADARHAALARVRHTTCRAFTSGCTMRLMSIGTIAEAQSDMLLCPPLRLGAARADVDADVFVTHPLPTSVHVLTCDYLLHRAPCVLAIAAGTLHLRLSNVEVATMAPGFRFFAARFVGGAFVVDMLVGDAPMRVVVDTGAVATLSLGRTAAKRLRTCTRGAPPRRTAQAGVNGEEVCSDVLRAPVRVGGVEATGVIDLGVVDVLVNEGEVEGADGYVGLGLLRAVDLWLEPGRIGFRRNGLAPRSSMATVEGACPSGGLPSCQTP
jgi:hypothetical protein